MSASIACLRIVPIPPPYPTLPPLQTTSNMYTSEEAGYSRQAEVFHAPPCSRYCDSRWGGSPEAGSGDETEDEAPYLHPDPPTKRVDSPGRAGKRTDQPSPDSGVSRRQLLPGPGERHQLPTPALDRAPPPPPGLSALNRAPPPELPGPGRPCRPLGLGVCGCGGPAGARRRKMKDPPALSTPTSV